MFLPTNYNWMRELEDACDDIKQEALNLSSDLFSRWFYYDEAKGWDVLGLIFAGHEFEANAERCPKTMALIRRIPSEVTIATFSKIKAGGRIPPHNGFTPTVLTYHLGLVVPKGCYLRSGDKTVAYEEGKSILFDDMPEHEAWNESGEDRITLMLNVVKPGCKFDSGLDDRTVELIYKKLNRKWGRCLTHA